MQTLFAFSANHTNMPLEVREQLAVTPGQQAACYVTLRETAGVEELYILSTCNRTELYACCDSQQTFDALLSVFAGFVGVEQSLLAQATRLTGDDAIAHLMRVACGIHSMVLGEPQILGQIKSAYTQAQRHKALGSRLEHLMQFTFSRVKDIRTVMPLGREPVSIASTMVKLVQQIFDSFTDKRLLLVGAGDTIELAARYLVGLGINRITITNRTIEHAEALASRFAARTAPLYDLPSLLVETDLVVTATASQLPIIGKGTVEAATNGRHGDSLVLFDLAVPRDIEVQVSELEGVFVYSIDDLGSIIEQNKSMRHKASEAAEAYIVKALAAFRAEQQQMSIGRELIAPLRMKAEELREAELQQAMRKLAAGNIPESVVYELAHNLTKKLMHIPSVEAKKHTESYDLHGFSHLSEEPVPESKATRH